MNLVAKTKKQNPAAGQNAFAGQKECPTESAISAVLGSSLNLWEKLIADLKGDLMIDFAEWHSSSVKYGWSFRLQLKKRNIVYLGPREGYFVAAFALGDRAVVAAGKSDLPPKVIRNINESKRYAEGTAVRIEVKKPADVDVVKTLAKIKIEN